MTPINTKLMIGGAAIGAYSQDPIDSPISATIGMGIGAYIGYNINPQLIAKEASVKSSDELLKISKDAAEEAIDTPHKRTAEAFNKSLRKLSKADNRHEVSEDFINSLISAYTKLGGEESIENKNLINLFAIASSNDESLKGITEDVVKNLVKNESDAEKLRDALNSVNINIEKQVEEIISDSGEKYYNVKRIASIYDEQSIFSISELGLRPEVAHDPSSVVSIGANATREKVEEEIKAHLIKNLNYPEGQATRVAKNVAIHTEGMHLEVQDNNLKVTANGKSSNLQFDEYKEVAGFERSSSGNIVDQGIPVRRDSNNNMYTSSRSNPYLKIRDGNALGANVAVMDSSGRVVTTNIMDGNVLNQSFSALELSLQEYSRGGRLGNLSEIFKSYDEAKSYVGNLKWLERARRDNPGSTVQSFTPGYLTDVKRQLVMNPDGTFRYTQVDMNDMRDISIRLAVNDKSWDSVNLELPSHMVGQNTVHKLNIGNQKREKLITSVGTAEKRALEKRLNRNKVGTANTSTEELYKTAEEILQSSGRKNSLTRSSVGNSSILSVNGVNENINDLISYINNGVGVGDGQLLIRRDALSGASVSQNFSITLGNTDSPDSKIIDLSENSEFSKELNRSISGQSPEGVRFKGGQRIAMQSGESPVYIPKEYTYAEFIGHRVNKNGKIIADFNAVYKPSDLNNVDVKLFGDFKATAVYVDNDTFDKINIFNEISNRGFFTGDDLSISKSSISKKLSSYFGVDVKNANDLARVIKMSSQDDLNVIKEKFRLSDLETPDILAPSGDIKLTKGFSNISDQDSARRYIQEALSSFEDQGLATIIRERHFSDLDTNHKDIISKARGLHMAVAAYTEDKAMQSGFATSLMLHGGSNDINSLSNRLIELSDITQSARNGDRQSALKVFDSFIFNSSKLNLSDNISPITYTMASVDIPIAPWSSNTISWMHMSELYADGFTDDMIDLFADKNNNAIYEGKSILKSKNKFGQYDMYDVFGSSYEDTKRRITEMFSSENTDRRNYLKSISNISSEDGIVSIKLDRPGKEIKSLSLNLDYTNRTGVFSTDGKEMLSAMDKQKKEVLFAQLFLRREQKTGNTARIQSAERMLDSAISTLEEMMQQADKPIAKEIAGRVAKNGSASQIRFIGGDATKVWDDIYKTGELSLFVDRTTVENMGIDLRNMTISDGTKINAVSEINGVQLGEGRYAFTTEDGKYIYAGTGREPIGGPNSRLTTHMILDTNLTSSKDGAIYFPDAKIGGAVESPNARKGMATIAQMMMADADGDTTVSYLLHKLNNSEEHIKRVKQSSSTTAEFVRNFGHAITATLTKANKGKSSKLSVSTDIMEKISGMLQGHERKHMAAKVTELNEIIKGSLEKQRAQDRFNIYNKYGIRSKSDLNSLSEETKAAMRAELDAVNRIRKESSSIGQTFVENTLKAVHKDGSSSNDVAPVELILNKLRQHTNALGNNASREGADMTLDLFNQLFDTNAENLDSTLKQYGISSKEDLHRVGEHIRKSMTNYAGEIATDSNRMIGGGGFAKSIEASVQMIEDAKSTASGIPKVIESLPQDAKSSIIRDIDIQKTLISTIRENRNKLIGGAAALAATSFFIGSETPDTSSPISSSPVSRSGAVLPALKQDNAYITNSFNRERDYGSVEVSGSFDRRYSDSQIKRNIHNMLQGDSQGRSTVRYSNQGSY